MSASKGARKNRAKQINARRANQLDRQRPENRQDLTERFKRAASTTRTPKPKPRPNPG